MFKIESYVTPILLSYVDKYVKDFKPADAQVSLWEGGVVLHNLVLKTDVLQQEVALPFTLVSGRIHELLIQVPWTKIMSEPITVTIDTIECILNIRPETDEARPEKTSHKTQTVEAPPGYMQALVRRIVSNISIRIHHLIVKYVHDDIVLSLNVKHLSIDSAGANWTPTFADIDPINPVIRRLVTLDDLTLCLDNSDSDGKIRFYQDPLLYRCGLSFRVLAKLISANTRRASSIEIELRTEKLAWGVTSDQLLLLLRLFKERESMEKSPSPTSPEKPQAPKLLSTTHISKQSLVSPAIPRQQPSTTSNITEPQRHESWSEWAWSWMPSVGDRENSREEAPIAAQPLPVSFSAYLDEISLVIKVLETEANNRKRPRSLLEFTALYAAIRCNKCAPTLLKVKLGIRYVLINSIGKCCCGHIDMNAASHLQTIYLCNRDEPSEWMWPNENDEKADVAQQEPGKPEKTQEATVATSTSERFDQQADEVKVVDIKVTESKTLLLQEENIKDNVPTLRSQKSLMLKPISGLDLFDMPSTESKLEIDEEIDTYFWDKLSPIIFMEFTHARSPPNRFINPYEHPPMDFEYSDWSEECDIRIKIKPLDLRICVGLIHRLKFIKKIFGNYSPPPLAPMRILTVEECEALNQNLPQRRINVELKDFRINVHPWDHSPTEKPMATPLLLLLELPKANIIITTPLYAQRVCSAAGQMPRDEGLLWHGCRTHCTTALQNIKISVCAPRDDQPKPCGRIDIRFVTHSLLYPEYFDSKDSILLSYAVKIREVNISGSAARLYAAVQIILSLVKENVSLPLYHTSLAKDALADEGLVAMDITAEDLSARGFITKKVTTFIFTLQSLRATVFQLIPETEELKQAWLFSGPEVATTTAYIRCAFQYCYESFPQEFSFFGVWTEPTAVVIDPLLISWLSYKPVNKRYSDLNTQGDLSGISSTQFFRRRATPSSSSGRGQTRSGSGSYAEQVHINKPRSVDSSSERSKNISNVQAATPPFLLGEELLKIYNPLKKVRVYIELGLILLYVTKKSATAVGCETVRVAMENHAMNTESVMVLSLGRWQMYSNTVPQYMWHYIRQDGPTYRKLEDVNKQKAEEESQFPWRLALSDVSCYSLELVIERQTGLSEPTGGLRSRLKTPTMARPVTILEHVSTNVTLSVVTKTIQHKIVIKKSDSETKQNEDKREAKLKYFTSGQNFRPTSFLEFLRGPKRRKKEFGTQSEPKEKSDVDETSPVLNVKQGPIVSLGINMHADTPPIVVRMDHKQVQQLAITVHCLRHFVTLLKRNPMRVHSLSYKTSRTTLRSDIDEETASLTDSTRSENQSDRLMTIFTVADQPEYKVSTIKTFFWFQWVISRATVVITAEDVKMAIDIDDISSSIDLQEHYNQFKVKLNSVVIKHFVRTDEGIWQTGALGGRVLEAREPINAQEDTNFLSTTITAARISSLPESWKQELHPKLFEQRNNTDTMLELYAVLAPLDIVIVPDTLENIQSVVKAMTVNPLCSMSHAQEHFSSTFDLPYVYLCAGGMKVLLACDIDNKNIDDTFLLTIGKIGINPHPENPICRRSASVGETGWSTSQGNLEGRQYELTLRNITLKTSNFFQLVTEQESASDKISSENPAHKWSQPAALPHFSTILHPLDIDLLYAPALILDGSLVCGPAVELNFTSDCTINLSVDQLLLCHAAMTMRPVDHTRRRGSTDQKPLEEGECPYADILYYHNMSEVRMSSTFNSLEDDMPSAGFTSTVDSGVDTATSRSKSGHLQNNPVKKTVSIALLRQSTNASDYLEAFITTGIFDLSLYTIDDDSEDIKMILPSKPQRENMQKQKENSQNETVEKETSDTDKSTLTDKIRYVDYGWTQIDPDQGQRDSIVERAVPLLHVTFHQPNLYYWKRKMSKHLQVSLFNMWFGLGVRQMDYYWHSPILSTARGEPDPMTDIPPALATMKYTSGYGNAPFISSSSLQRGALNLDVERPILVEAPEENVRRLIGIYKLIAKKIKRNDVSEEEEVYEVEPQAKKHTNPLPYKIRGFFKKYSIEVANVQTNQIGLSCAGATLGWEGFMAQINMNSRRDQLGARIFVTAMMLSADNGIGTRQSVIHPHHIGMQINACWEPWLRAEGGRSAKEPTVRILIDTDSLNVDLTPNILIIVDNVQQTIKQLKDLPNLYNEFEEIERISLGGLRNIMEQTPSAASLYEISDDGGDHFYKDDLRSGAFKIVRGGQLPMAYQVTLYKHVVSWRYPHPRAITRLVAFPLPGQEEEVACALEFYSLITNQWETYVIVHLPVTESREFVLHSRAPELVFSTIWRFRILSPYDKPAYYQFNAKMFQPTSEPVWVEDYDPNSLKGKSDISADQLSGILRVDSYFAPRSTPRTRLQIRFASLEIHLHNKITKLRNQETALEGYYVSKPLMRSHRVLAVVAQQGLLNCRGGTPAGTVFLFKTQLSSRIIECDTGTMEPLADTFNIQFGISFPENIVDRSRLRLCMTSIRVALHIARLRTLQKLAKEWQRSYRKHLKRTSVDEKEINLEETADEAADILEGKVTLWIHNCCSVALRLGQEGTDEIFPLRPGAKLAYRWRDPGATKKLRFSLATASADWCWSNSIPFAVGESRVRFENPKLVNSGPSGGQFLFVSVKQTGARKTMRLAGRLVLANMLKLKLIYKVRAKLNDSNTWRTLSSSELSEESIGWSIISAYNTEMVLKIRFINHDTGWSGDIPLKECPKENVPWLVKVPSEGDVRYISVWCRVVRTRNDGRIFASIWPLYVLRSHLTLDIDVLLTSDICTSALEPEPRPPPLIQTAQGRGTTTHLLAPGTTSARHTLTFQYRNIDCPVTQDSIPLHYGVTDTSVFDKRVPVLCGNDVIEDMKQWLYKSNAKQTSESWPFSLVSKHWLGEWKSALLQPRCDVTVRYEAVRAGGSGCSLELRLAPVLLVCNAALTSITLRAHDAAPLCKLESGTVISPPSIVLKKPFFMSVEMHRETFVSKQLEVCHKEPGRYGELPLGQVAIDRPTTFAIPCNNKVIILSLHYEIKEEINVMGLTASYVFVNKLNCPVLIAAVAVPNEEIKPPKLGPKKFKLIPPCKSGSTEYVPLCMFALHNRWRGGDVTELSMYLCLALPTEETDLSVSPAQSCLPVQLGALPIRRPLALTKLDGTSMSVVVTQHKHDGRWMVTLGEDPCPQFVVHNQTSYKVAIAQPQEAVEGDTFVHAKHDCPGVSWFCQLKSGSWTHYSGPGHIFTQVLPYDQPAPHPMLTFARLQTDREPNWCSPVEITSGEQLVQLTSQITMKVRVRTYPHSTLVELQDVDQNDISASDIRNRLLHPYSFEDINMLLAQKKGLADAHTIERIGGNVKLLGTEMVQAMRRIDMKLLEMDLKDIVAKSEQKSSTHVFKTLTLAQSGVISVEERTPKFPTSRKTYVVEKSNLKKTTSPEIAESEKNYTGTKQVDIRTHDDEFSSNTPTTSKSNIRRVSAVNSETADDGESIQETKSAALLEASYSPEESNIILGDEKPYEWNENMQSDLERVRFVVSSVSVELGTAEDARPLLAAHVDRAMLLLSTLNSQIKTTISIADVQVDNLQYDSGQFDFAVIATTRAETVNPDNWPTVWNMFMEQNTFSLRPETSRVMLSTVHDSWTVLNYDCRELTEVDFRAGPLALYIEDAYITALVGLFRLALPPTDSRDYDAVVMAQARPLQNPLRLRVLNIHPVDLTLTLHTAVRMYIALDQSPLHLNGFKLLNMFTTTECLTHALTVHYLSAAILGAGWVVGGLELLGAPGALAARVGGATGGVRGVASTAAAALLRSLSACAGSLARNLDLLAGDEEHARRAAAARRRPPDSFVGGLVAGFTNFAINILGAVGGLAHHPLVGVAVGEYGGAAALRRSLVGALTKPLSATADLVAYAGHGLLKQTGWDPVPQPRPPRTLREEMRVGWRRDCVRWIFRLADHNPFAGFEVLLDDVAVQLLLTHRYIIVAEPESERILEMIDSQCCRVGPYSGGTVELSVTQKRHNRHAKVSIKVLNEDEEFELKEEAMQRVAWYTGAESVASGSAGGVGEARVLQLVPVPGQTQQLHAALLAVTHANTDTHFSLM